MTNTVAGARLTQAERSARARAKLLNSAIHLIAEKGLRQATLVNIAREAGMTRGAIQHHFSGRDELVLAILHELEERVRTSFAVASLDPQASLERRIERLIDHFGVVGQSNAYLAVVDIWLNARGEPDVRDAVRDSMLRSAASYRNLWQGAFGKDAPARAISECRRVVVAVLRGAVVSRVFVNEPRSFAMTLGTLKRMIQAHLLAAAEADAAARSVATGTAAGPRLLEPSEGGNRLSP